MKKLIKITHVQDDICEVVVNLENEKDGVLLSSALIGVMAKSPRAARAIVAAAATFMKRREEAAKAQGKKDTKAS